MLLVHYCSGLQDCAEQVNRQGLAQSELTFQIESEVDQPMLEEEAADTDNHGAASLASDWQNISDSEC